MTTNSLKKQNAHKLENVVIIGNGGRENSLAWVIQKNKFIKNIYLIPGNGGSKHINKCQNLEINYSDFESLKNRLNELNVDLVVIGPETPLADGLGDKLRLSNFDVFGPNTNGAILESSKSWAKDFMKEANIPTADFWVIDSIEKAEEIIKSSSNPLVVKADGLASGKGVVIPENKEETINATKDALQGKFGEAGKKVVLEEKIEGPEVSIFALCDGKKYVLLPTAQDHKRLEENDKGLNTGGMGAYSPTPLIKSKEMEVISQRIIQPTIDELNKRNIDYRGVLYFGLMLTKDGPKVIEYNCRFGDPECQTIMPLMDENFINILKECAIGNLSNTDSINPSNKVSGCVIATSEGYPSHYKVGYPIHIEKLENKNIQIFHSGTKNNEQGRLITNGGRVLSIVCHGNNFDDVFKEIYETLNKIKFKGIFYRKDIGNQVRDNFINKGESK